LKNYVYYSIKSSVFIGNIADSSDGGAIYVDNVKILQIDSCQFIDNYAEKNGGAISTNCNSGSFDCTLNIIGTNVFTSNYANVSGGAVFWDDVEPIIDRIERQKFSGNEARIYADNIASFPAKMIAMNESEY